VTRLTLDEYGLALADVVASYAACTRRQVGAVIIGPNKRIVSTGCNGTKPGELNCPDGGCPRGMMSYEEQPALSDYSGSNCIHAEDNAIDADIPNNSTLYINTEPCYKCRERIAKEDSISRVVWPEGEYINHG